MGETTPIELALDYVNELKDVKNPRAKALVITKLEEALMWSMKMYQE
jgi:hypothetical protein